jgi:hypothetical protein
LRSVDRTFHEDGKRPRERRCENDIAGKPLVDVLGGIRGSKDLRTAE